MEIGLNERIVFGFQRRPRALLFANDKGESASLPLPPDVAQRLAIDLFSDPEVGGDFYPEIKRLLIEQMKREEDADAEFLKLAGVQS